MKKPRSGKELTFPYKFEKNGRVGTIYKLGNGTFKTYFRYAGEEFPNTFSIFERAYEYLEREFSKLDSDRANALSLNPLNSDVRNYAELEHLLREKGGGATLREAVTFFLAHHKTKKFEPKTVSESAETFLEHQRANNVSPGHLKTLEKHFRRFREEFGARKIHDVSALEITNWLNSRKDERTGNAWGVKTRTTVIGSLVSLSLFAKDTLKAIPDIGDTEAQKVRRPKRDAKGEVDIYTPEEFKRLLLGALECDLDLLPALIIGGFQGLRPAEIHGEGTKRRPLTWEAFIWGDGMLHVTGQKVRSKANRLFPIHAATKAWLEPFKEQTGEMWRYTHAYIKKMVALREATNVRSVPDGLRHSYASYRIRHLKGNLPQLAEEMGNSPREIVDSYKKNVTDTAADEWFNLRPPADYCSKVKAVLTLRKAL